MKPSLFTTLVATAVLAGCASAPQPSAGPTYVDVARFRAINVESVEIAPTAAALDADERAALGHKLHLALVDAIPASARAAGSGEGVLRVKITVTRLDPANPGLNALTSALIVVPVDRGGIAFDATFFDAHGEVAIGSTTVRHRSRMLLDLGGNFTRYGAAVGALRDWGVGISGHLART